MWSAAEHWGPSPKVEQLRRIAKRRGVSAERALGGPAQAGDAARLRPKDGTPPRQRRERQKTKHDPR